MRIGIIALGFAVLACGVAAIGLTTVENVGCANEVLSSLSSPDQKFVAIIFTRDCGATTTASTQVSVLPFAAKLPNEAGNIFISDTNHGAAPSGQGGGPQVLVRWRSPTQAVVVHHHAARVFQAKSALGTVGVSYEQFASRPGA